MTPRVKIINPQSVHIHFMPGRDKGSFHAGTSLTGHAFFPIPAPHASLPAKKNHGPQPHAHHNCHGPSRLFPTSTHIHTRFFRLDWATHPPTLLIDGIVDGEDHTHILLPRIEPFVLPQHRRTDRGPRRGHRKGLKTIKDKLTVPSPGHQPIANPPFLFSTWLMTMQLPSWRCSTAALKGRPTGPGPRADAWG